jgi:hypothetical protein
LSARLEPLPEGNSAEVHFFRYIKVFSTAPDTAGPEKSGLFKMNNVVSSKEIA